MSMTQAIADALLHGCDAVECLRDYLLEKDSRVTRWEAAGLVKTFEKQVGLLIQSALENPAILDAADQNVILVAHFRAARMGNEALAQVLAHELEKRASHLSTICVPQHG